MAAAAIPIRSHGRKPRLRPAAARNITPSVTKAIPNT